MFKWLDKRHEKAIKKIKGLKESNDSIEKLNEACWKIMGKEQDRREEIVPITFPERRHA